MRRVWNKLSRNGWGRIRVSASQPTNKTRSESKLNSKGTYEFFWPGLGIIKVILLFNFRAFNCVSEPCMQWIRVQRLQTWLPKENTSMNYTSTEVYRTFINASLEWTFVSRSYALKIESTSAAKRWSKHTSMQNMQAQPKNTGNETTKHRTMDTYMFKYKAQVPLICHHTFFMRKRIAGPQIHHLDKQHITRKTTQP